jgi:hypothetical protein
MARLPAGNDSSKFPILETLAIQLTAAFAALGNGNNLIQ